MIVSSPAPYDSFATTAEADAYHNLRGHADWAASTNAATKAKVLVVGADYLCAEYRFSVHPIALDGSVHPLVIAANAILARHALTIDLFGVPLEKDVASQSGNLGPLVTSVTYRPSTSRDRFPQVTALLAPLADLRNSSVGYGTLTR